MKKLIALLASSWFAGGVWATTAAFDTKVNRTLVSSDFGECMMQPITPPSSSGLTCPDTWLTLDCAGLTGSSRALGQSKFDKVLLAELTGATVRVKVDDQVKVNGYCLVVQIQSVN